MRPAAARPAPCPRGRYRGAAGSRHRWQARKRPWRARQRSPRHVRPSDRWCRSRRVLPWSGRRPVWLGDRLCCPASFPDVWTVPGRLSACAAEEISGDGATSTSRGTQCHVAWSHRFRSSPEGVPPPAGRSVSVYDVLPAYVAVNTVRLGGSRKNVCPGRGHEAPRHGGVGCRLEVNTTGSNKHSPSPNPATVSGRERKDARSLDVQAQPVGGPVGAGRAPRPCRPCPRRPAP